MAGLTRVDLAGLRRAQLRVEQLAPGVVATLTRLRSALDAEGPCWGFDETGQAFEAAYRPAAATVREAFTELGRTIDSIARGLSLVAHQAEAVDGRAATRLA